MNHGTGKEEIILNGEKYLIQYEIENDIDGWFDLTVWHDGDSIRRRVPRYQADTIEDIRQPHGPMLLAKIIGVEVDTM